MRNLTHVDALRVVMRNMLRKELVTGRKGTSGTYLKLCDHKVKI